MWEGLHRLKIDLVSHQALGGGVGWIHDTSGLWFCSPEMGDIYEGVGPACRSYPYVQKS